MSKITNEGLTRSDTLLYICRHKAKGRQRVDYDAMSKTLHIGYTFYWFKYYSLISL